MSRAISRRVLRRASGAALLAALQACGAARAKSADEGHNSLTGYGARAYQLGEVYLLEMSGTPPADTTVRIRRGVARIVVLRQGPPDNIPFAALAFPARAADTASRDSVSVTIRPRPGVYGIDLESPAPLAAVQVTFKYAVHFAAPADALKKYGNAFLFERALAIGRLLPSGGIQFLPSTRSASDNLEAIVPSAGSYVVGAPR
jgi:hypothetical protein